MVKPFDMKASLLGFLSLTALLACGTSTNMDGTKDDGGAPPGDAGAGECPSSGEGTLQVDIEGLPAGVLGHVVIGATTVTADQTLTLSAGSYTVDAQRVAGADPLVRTAYEPTVEGVPSAGLCVRRGETAKVTVRYAAIASSNKLWTGNGPGGSAPLLGFAAASLGASGSPPATVAAKTGGAKGFAFDRAGNLWVLGNTTADAPVARYPASSLGASGDKTADIELQSPAFSGGSPGPVVAAFDAKGAMWVSIVYSQKVVKFDPEQLRASGNVTPSVELGPIEGPSGLAFDSAGNLFVASGAKRIYRFDAAHLAASATTADLSIEAMSPPPVIGTLADPLGIAFDASGSLWVNYDGTIAKLPAADLAGTGSKQLTPAIQIKLSVTALAEGIAFDESGGLWLAGSAGNFLRLGPTQLTSGGDKTPEVIITSPDVGYASWFALYPAPAALPLYHRLP
jgi:sugar lactone lactonase YvrE